MLVKHSIRAPPQHCCCCCCSSSPSSAIFVLKQPWRRRTTLPPIISKCFAKVFILQICFPFLIIVRSLDLKVIICKVMLIINGTKAKSNIHVGKIQSYVYLLLRQVWLFFSSSFRYLDKFNFFIRNFSFSFPYRTKEILEMSCTFYNIRTSKNMKTKWQNINSMQLFKCNHHSLNFHKYGNDFELYIVNMLIHMVRW